MNRLFFAATLLLLFNYEAVPGGSVLRLVPVFLLLMVALKQSSDNISGAKSLLDPFLMFIIGIVCYGVLIASWNAETYFYKIFKVASFILFIFTFIKEAHVYVFTKRVFTGFVNLIYLPILVYMSINIVLFLLGLQNDGDGESIGLAVVLSSIGISVDRVRFALASGINAYGAFVGSMLLFSLVGRYIIKSRFKRIFFVGILITVITLLLTDSRGPTLFAVLIFFLIKFFYSRMTKPRALWLIPLISIIGPFLVVYTLTLLAETSYGDSFSRTSEDFATGNGRLLIWGIAVNEFLTFKINHIFGYGEYGHFVSGASQQWAFIFGSRETADFVHPHNTLLSIAFDYGYFGLIVFFAFQYSVIGVIKKIWNVNRGISYILLSSMLFINMIGVTETMFGFYYQNVLYLLCMINIFAFLLKRYYKIKNTKFNV